MKIENNSPVTPPRETQAVTRPVQPTSPVAPFGTQDSVVLQPLSVQLQALEGGLRKTSDVDMARVEAIRQAIAEGRYEVNASAIAEGLITSARESLRPA